MLQKNGVNNIIILEYTNIKLEVIILRQFIRKNHKLIDLASVSLFIFSLTTLVLIYFFNKLIIDIKISVISTFVISAIVSAICTNKINIFLHNLFNLND